MHCMKHHMKQTSQYCYTSNIHGIVSFGLLRLGCSCRLVSPTSTNKCTYCNSLPNGTIAKTQSQRSRERAIPLGLCERRPDLGRVAITHCQNCTRPEHTASHVNLPQRVNCSGGLSSAGPACLPARPPCHPDVERQAQGVGSC